MRDGREVKVYMTQEKGLHAEGEEVYMRKGVTIC